MYGILFLGDFNFDIKSYCNKDKLGTFCTIFKLSNTVRSETWFMRKRKSTIEQALTHKPLNFKKTLTIEIGGDDHHKIIIFFQSAFIQLIYLAQLKNYSESGNICVKFTNFLNNTEL